MSDDDEQSQQVPERRPPKAPPAPLDPNDHLMRRVSALADAGVKLYEWLWGTNVPPEEREEHALHVEDHLAKYPEQMRLKFASVPMFLARAVPIRRNVQLDGEIRHRGVANAEVLRELGVTPEKLRSLAGFTEADVTDAEIVDPAKDPGPLPEEPEPSQPEREGDAIELQPENGAAGEPPPGLDSVPHETNPAGDFAGKVSSENASEDDFAGDGIVEE